MKMLAGVAALMLGAVTAGAAGAVALPYSKLVVFGDSLVDSGNAQAGSIAMYGIDPAPAAAGYFQGRFSNGYNFADDISVDMTGLPATASSFGGTNFSVGGADAVTKPGERSPSFTPQRAAAAGTLNPTSLANALVLVTFGGNDIRDIITDTTTSNADAFAGTLLAMRTGIQSLIDNGAQRIVVTGLPDIGDLPASRAKAVEVNDPSILGIATRRSEYLNQQFSYLVNDLEGSSGVNLTFFDLLGYERDLVANPASYGLPALSTTSYCQAGGAVAVVVQQCAGYLYFDPIHPTKQVHRAIATALENVVQSDVPEPASWAMMLAGFGAVGTMLRMRRRGVAVA